MTADPAALAEALAADLCQRICALVGEPRMLVPGEVNALLLASPGFAHLLAAERAGAWSESRRDLAHELRESGAWTELRMAEWVEMRADRNPYRVEADHEQ